MVANSVHSSPRLYDLGPMSDKNSLASILNQTAQVDALSVRPLAPVSPPSSSTAESSSFEAMPSS